MALFDDLLTLNPVLRELNITPQWLQAALADSADTSELYSRIRQLPQYKQRFQGATRGDGTQRWTEAEHIAREDQIRGLLRKYGVDVNKEYATPASLIGFHESEQALDEIRDRLEVWDYVKTAGQTIRETFYVYAGLKIDNDDVYEAVVDGAREQALFNDYNTNRAAMSFDYPGWITRATQTANQRVATELQRLQTTGALTGQAVQRILSVDPGFGRQIMDVLYLGGEQGGVAGTLDLQTLLSAYESAAIGAAARESGLELPTKERLGEIRAAGVQREAAIKTYREYGRDQNRLSAAVMRARGVGFGQKEFEDAEFLGNATQSRNLSSGIGYMEAAGKTQGSFRFREDAGRITQMGFTRF
ncbi:MAG: hypothetical protein M3Q75_05675 [Gemmatimonadota bacterium]|nr:hypothetical protein [Gemmatimonadota bacterium]